MIDADLLFTESSDLASAVDARKFATLGSFDLENGEKIDAVQVAFQTWGTLNAQADNAVLVCHAISGDSDVFSWWSKLVGPGKLLNPEEHFIICSNALGGCRGTTGPSSLAPDGKKYGSRFPKITIGDMVTVQQALLNGLGVARPLLVCGGSMGGAQGLEWGRRGAAEHVWLTASCAAHNPFQIAFNEVARQAIFADPKWRNGDYPADDPPTAGLAAARMAGHLSYLSSEAFENKFARRFQAGMDDVFEVESYLRYQGSKFTTRFDAGSLVVLSRALDRYACTSLVGSSTKFLFTSYSSDWLYTSAQSADMHKMAQQAGCQSRFEEIDLPYGHDSFLLDDIHQPRIVGEFLQG